MIGDALSFIAGTLLLIASALVVIAYRPQSWSMKDAPGALAFAIALSFMAAAGNTLFWQVFGHPAITYGWLTVKELRDIGDFMDVLFKGGAAFAAYLHLRALHMALPPSERREWHTLEMPFYPKKWACLRLSVRVIRKRLEKDDG